MKVKAGALISITTIALVALAAPVAAGTSRECPDTSTDDNLRLKVGYCEIPETATVGGNIRIKDGTLVVRGTVEGNVIERGSGNVEVKPGGRILGNVIESGDGRVGARGYIAGNVIERGGGGVLVEGTVGGNVLERGDGDVVLDVIISNRPVVHGNVIEGGVGDVKIDAKATVGGNAAERGVGSCTVNGAVGGNLLGGCKN